MTREEAYGEGWHSGRRWAEHDIRERVDLSGQMLADAKQFNEERRGGQPTDFFAAWTLGMARGYRDTFARYEAGEVTWETFDTVPLNK